MAKSIKSKIFNLLSKIIIILFLVSCARSETNQSLINDLSESTKNETKMTNELDNLEDVYETNESKNIKKIDDYKTVKFGNYYINSSEEKEPVEWLVLNVDEKNNSAMLMSKYVLDAKEVDLSTFTENFYFTSLGMYLSNELLLDIFDEEENKQLITFYEDNYFFGIYDDIDHYTKITLPSTDEMIKLLPNARDRVTYPTNYAINNKIEVNTYKEYCTGSASYWLRNKGADSISYQYITYYGYIDKCGARQHFKTLGIRPIIWVDMSVLSDEEFNYYIDNAININKIQCRKKLEEEQDFNKYNVGDDLYFGHYYDFINNKNEGAKLIWEVVDKDLVNDRILVINKYPAYNVPYNASMQNVNWEKSTLRKWLNEDFYKKCFDDDERNRIIKTKIENTYNYKPDKETEDYIYIMSKDELDKYYQSDSAKHAIRFLTTVSTDSVAKYEKMYATNSEVTRFDIINALIWNCNYWVRDVIMSGKNALNVDGNGKIDTIGVEMTNDRMQVRPCMWLSLQNSKDEINEIELKKENIDYSNYFYIDEDDKKINFGRYRQDGIDEDINDVSDISWIVVKRDEINNEAILMSEKVLEFIPYKSYFLHKYKYVNWESSTLRTWLNGAFYTAAFNDEEKSKIINHNSYIEVYQINDEGEFIRKDIYDKVFIPSAREFDDFLNVLEEDELRPHTTKYAISGISNMTDIQDINKYLIENTYRYWLRNHGGSSEDDMREVYFADNRNIDTADMYSSLGVRPMIKVKYFDDINLKEKYEKVNYIDKIDENTKFKDIIKIGNINQENLFDNSPVEWMVLKNDKENKRVLLISKNILDYYKYENDLPNDFKRQDLKELWGKPWEESNVKKWLNDEFINELLSKSEEQHVLNINNNGKLFILSRSEIEEYMPITTLRKCKETKMANLKINNDRYIEDKYVRWWPRDSVYTELDYEYTLYVTPEGDLAEYLYSYYPKNFPIRPAMWVSY